MSYLPGGHSICGIIQNDSAAVNDENLGPCQDNCAGNPLNIGTGNKYQEEVDYSPPYEGSVRFVRFYNSLEASEMWAGYGTSSVIGSNWRHYYMRSIRRVQDVDIYMLVTRWDARVLRFKLVGGAWVQKEDHPERLTELSGGAWELRNAENELEYYDATGKLTSIIDAKGRTTTLVYSEDAAAGADANFESNGRSMPPGTLVRLVDFKGRVLTLKYVHGPVRLSRAIDPTGEVIQYAYSTQTSSLQKRLLSVTYGVAPSARTRTYLYNEQAYTANTDLPNSLTGIVDENNFGTSVRWSTFKYQSNGKAVSTEYDGGVNRYALAHAGTTVNLTHPLQSTPTHTYTHQVIGGVVMPVAVTRPCPGCGTSTATSTKAYDANRNLDSLKDFNGNLSCFTYDTARNLESSRIEGLSGTGTCASKVTTSATRTITTEWHSTWRLPKRIAEPLKITTLAYNGDPSVSCAPAGASSTLLCSRTAQATTDANGSLAFTATADGAARTTGFTYNLAGQLLSIDGPRSDVSDVTSMTYYTSNDPSGHWKAGDLATRMNAVGQTTQFIQYDAAGRLKKSIDPNGQETILEYWPRGWLKSLQVGSSTAGFETTQYEYDYVGQLTKVTLPDSSFMAYRYDNAHRLYEVHDGLNNKITYTLDAAGNRSAEETRDPSNALLRQHSRVFDVLGRLWKDIGGTDPATQIMQNARDASGNVTSILDPLARTTTQEYDARDRLLKVKDPFNGTSAPTQYGYNAQDVLTSVTDPKGLVTTYTVNGHGETLTLSSPDTGTTTFTYDAAGNVATKLDARSVNATYTTDALGRVTQIIYPDETVTYTHDSCTNGIGRLCSIADKTGSTAFSYDIFGRVTGKNQVTAGLTRAVVYAHNGLGQLASVTTPSGQLIEYGYSNNRPVSVKVNATTVLDTVYWEPFGPNGGWRWGNSTTGAPNLHTRLFDLDYRATRATSDLPLSGATPALDRLVGWDRQSRVISITDYANSALSATYGLDALDRLTSVSQGANVLGFTYDGVGNRLTQTVNAATTTYAYPGTSHRLSGLSGATSKTFTHDGAGNQTADGTVTWTFGGNNRPTQAVSGATTTFDINALGQRVRKGSTWFAYDEQGRLLGEYGSGGTLIQETVWLDDLPIATLRPNGGGVDMYYVHPDHLGTPRAVSRSTDNQVVWRWDNTEPFGNSAPNENPSGLGAFSYNLRFPGQYYDAETGLHYNLRRDYDPRIGRYVESDPIGLGGGLNTFGYVGGNPLSNTDPTGLATFPIPTPFPIPICRPGESGGCRPMPDLPMPQPSPAHCFTSCVILAKGLLSAGNSGVAAGLGEHGGKIGRAYNMCMNSGPMLAFSITAGVSYCSKKCGYGSDMPQPLDFKNIELP